MNAHQGTSHRAIATVIGTLFMIVYAIVGSAITLGPTQEILNTTQLSSDLPIESIRISGYDARDTTRLQVHNGLFTNDNSAGASDGFILKNERIGIYLQNNSVEKIVISELRFAGTVYEFSGDTNKLGSFGSNTAPGEGKFVILSKAPDVLVNSVTAELQPGQLATVILGLDKSFKLGRAEQIKITTTNGSVILGTIVTGAHQVPNSDFVNTVINNPGEQEQPQEQPQAQCNPVTIDFETNANGVPLSAGSIISNQWHTNDIHISANNDHGSHPNETIIFNSNNPTGGDSDLGPPWSTGNVGADSDLGNILIIAEDSIDTDGDGLVDDPDDEAKGGVIYIDILNSNYHCSLGFDLIDIEQTEGNSGYVLINFEGGGSLKKHFNDFPGVSYGDNSFNRITLSAGQIGQTFNRVEIFLDGSGAIDNILLG